MAPGAEVDLANPCVTQTHVARDLDVGLFLAAEAGRELEDLSLVWVVIEFEL